MRHHPAQKNSNRFIRWSLLLIMAILTIPQMVSAAKASTPPPAWQGEIRESAIAGSWYPDSPDDLKQTIETFLDAVPNRKSAGELLALISPHAGYAFSGQVAAYAYKLLTRRTFDTVVIIAPSHHASFPGVSVYDKGGYRTPLGIVPLDRDLIGSLKQNENRIHYVPEAHAKEHSLEIQLPFLQTVMPGFKLVPLIMGDQRYETCQWLADALAQSIRGRSVLIVASSDLSHFHAYAEAKRLDQVVTDDVRALDPQKLSYDLASSRCEACGGGPMVTALLAARKLGANKAQSLFYANSGDVTGDRSRVVGYMAAALWKSSGQTAAPQEPQKAGIDLGLSGGEKALLHRIAREAIEAHCRGETLARIEATSKKLKEPCGAFVTLHKHGQLRGCIGHIVGDRPLAETVSQMAIAAAFHDPRFPPVQAEELKDLEIEISVMTPLRQITNVEEIQVGVHGIIIEQDGRSGLLLPQVATEYGWDRNTFLEYTCRKANLPRDAWKDKNTKIFIFSADVF